MAPPIVAIVSASRPKFAAPDVTVPKDDERDAPEPSEGDKMQARVAEAIKNPDTLKALKEADKDRKGFSGKALDDDAWREQVADILNQQVAP